MSYVEQLKVISIILLQVKLRHSKARRKKHYVSSSISPCATLTPPMNSYSSMSRPSDLSIQNSPVQNFNEWVVTMRLCSIYQLTYYEHAFMSSFFLIDWSWLLLFRKEQKCPEKHKKKRRVFWFFMCPMIAALILAVLASSAFGMVTLLTKQTGTASTGIRKNNLHISSLQTLISKTRLMTLVVRIFRELLFLLKLES